MAEKLGLKPRDIVLKINGESATNLTSKDADDMVLKGANEFEMQIERYDLTYLIDHLFEHICTKISRSEYSYNVIVITL